MSDLMELAARVEAATGPDRELDMLIEIRCGPDSERVKTIMAGSPHNTIEIIAKTADDKQFGSLYRIPRYTASLDAVMMLYPDDPPPLVPSNPRICAADALRVRELYARAQGDTK